MPSSLIYLFVFVVVLDIIIVLMLALLKRRGVWVYPKTMFGPALVFDSNDDEGTVVRLLNVRGKYQSVSYVDSDIRWKLVCAYHLYMDQVIEMVSETCTGAPSVLIIGGGAYSLPKAVLAEYPKSTLTVVEIDPTITKIARERFFLDECLDTFDAARARSTLVNEDGWAYLQKSACSYNVIVNDAFAGKKPLGPLSTREGAHTIAARLSQNGAYLANVITPLEGPKSHLLQESLDVCCEVFEHVYLIAEDPEEPQVVANNVLVASHTALPLASEYCVK